MESHMRHRPSVVCVLPLSLLLASCATAGRHHQLSNLASTQWQAEQAYAQGNLQQALKGYQALIKAMPKQADFWFRLGNVQFRQGQPHYAAKSYLKALQIDPGNQGAWYNLGIVRLREAEAAFVQAAQQGRPSDPLQQRSTGMADGIAHLTGVKPGQTARIEQSPTPPVASSVATPKGDGT